MAPKKKAASTLNLLLLASIVAATNNSSFVYVSDADAAPFLSHSPALVEVNAAMADANGAKATRATTEGISFSAANPAAAASGTAASAASKPTFQIFKGVELPAIKRVGNAGSSTYPFDTMEVKDAFFVPATAERPEPAKALASTVSSATRRYASEQGTKEVADRKNPGQKKTIKNLVPTKRFEVRAIEDGAAFGAPGVKGALISRTA